MKAVLTIAGSDSSGGAGIQADIKTIAAHRLFAMSAITALTAQNTTGVYGVVEVDPLFVERQIDVVFEDIRPDAVKIGMIPSAAIVEAIARALRRNCAEHVVVDPVMVATSGSSLSADDAVDASVELLFPLAEIITPNLPEAAVLAGISPEGEEGCELVADLIAKRSAGIPAAKQCPDNFPAVLVKGGHGESGVAADLLRKSDGTTKWFRGERIDTHNTHGTGCTLSSAIACGLAQGLPLEEAVGAAKAYVSGALSQGLDLGRGSGPLDHMWEYE